MYYLTKPEDIKTAISKLVHYKTLWLDTEIADWYTPNPRLSLIQILTNPKNIEENNVYVLDVLDKPDLIQDFINQIMKNPQIEKVFHNASFDIKYLGGKEEVKNVTCTLKIAKKIGKHSLNVPNLKLKTLAEYLCNLPIVEDQQASDWGKRPLTELQLNYAKMDVVYLANVHHYLLTLNSDKTPPIFTPEVGENQELFNHLSAKFIEYLIQDPQIPTLFESSPDQLQLETIASQLQKILYQSIFFPYLQEKITTEPHQAPQLQKTWQSLSHLIKYWTELLIANRYHYSPSELLPKTLNSPPSPIDEKIGQNLVSILNAFGIKVDYVGAIAAPAFIRVKLKPYPGVKVVSIINRCEDLQVQMGINASPMIQPQAGFVSVDIPRQDRQIAKFEDYITSSNSSPTHELKIAIGVNLEGKLIEADLADSNSCHFLVGGTTGSGKSEFLRSLLLSLLARHSPQWLQIVLVDPKRVTFPEFEGIPWLYEPVIKDEEKAIILMEQLVEEMETRYRILEKAGYSDLKTYNQTLNLSQEKPIPRIVCIFDEYADFMTEKDTRNQLEQSIKKLGAKARAAGIHLIIATQRPEARIVTPLIRSNLPGRIALKTASAADSKIILGDNQPEAYQLLGKGDLLYPQGTTLERLQALFASNFNF
ncbi:cell divisionFtsK/SpoIIIE [Gloeothece citriformis PCC 7424]|uniref:Cell divisionFtsK/SpoIIIE n=1 Tax=Gloeothece citriformis (strain PCC 7424) TaxID=65393 RepID=B7KH03_GLOC7|nr:DNA translocase FtsK [Gloeothece citriformis]ACK73490.1 cell divisionFtsK/SpoIIIE [Gloeothece citriformis PCC 7424]